MGSREEQVAPDSLALTKSKILVMTVYPLNGSLLSITECQALRI